MANDLPMNLRFLLPALLLLVTASLSPAAGTAGESATLGLFSGHQDVGDCAQRGAVVYAAAKSGTYTVAGGGENMWFTNDAFHFVWARATGDVSVLAQLAFPRPGGNAHRKACLLVRQGLEPGSAYADAALHGDGLTSLQYRETTGARTYEIQANVTAPRWLRVDKRGAYVSMQWSADGRTWTPAGGSFRLALQDPFFVGLGVCAHDNRTIETAVFSDVQVLTPVPPTVRSNLFSTLETVNISSKDRRAIYGTPQLIEAPNWTPNGAHLLFNSRGRIYRIPVKGGEPEAIETGFATRCNNDHGLSPDGTQLAISDHAQAKHSLIYVVPAAGGVPRLVTPLGPSYWHGWSPDGQRLAYCAERSGEFDIYTVPVAGGTETRLTTAAGLDDGPEYSPDGQYLYFNSERSGSMQIWRMHPDGSGQEAVTADGYNNWFPHPSPDGRWIVFLSYEPGVRGHPANQDVQLRIMPASGGRPEVLAKLFGGQGTINVPSWSPDSKQVAFVSYQLR